MAKLLNVYYWNIIVNHHLLCELKNFDDSFIYEELTKSIQEQKIPMHQMMRDEALKAFQIWDKKTDKVKY